MINNLILSFVIGFEDNFKDKQSKKTGEGKMNWMIEAFKEIIPKRKKDNKGVENMPEKTKKPKLEPPKPPKDEKPVVLDEDELKAVPEDDKMMYMELKRKNPEMAEKMLADYRKKQKKDLPKQKITVEDIILDTHSQVLEMRKDLNAFFRLYGR